MTHVPSSSHPATNLPLMSAHAKVPEAYLWPEKERPAYEAGEPLNEPVIDLSGFLSADEASIRLAADMVGSACQKHGFFQVRNHGVGGDLISRAVMEAEAFFGLPLHKKEKVQGYSYGHSHRFASKLPWKETFSFPFHASNPALALNHLQSILGGHESAKTGLVYKEYCEAMTDLAMKILELLAISLGLERTTFRRFYQDSCSLLRCNFYPPCEEPDLTLGTGPHCDPTSLTILHQDHVGGLEVFAAEKWRRVAPRPGALVINIGDTFMALTNGKYRSCLHRAVVNRDSERKSLAFFLNPNKDNIVRAPEELVLKDGRRVYPDFTWAAFLGFTQHNYRADMNTLDEFCSWLLNQGQQQK
ncbi:gibberellin 20 oxidase 3-like [Nymphaea colorata]|nr:gibberellin 20 oxidase 3-like [Nymphaea colorata]